MKPDYTNSIVNLMSSIISTDGVTSPYFPLDTQSLSGLDDAENIVLLVLDGLGYDYLKNFGSKTCIAHHLKKPITTVFPPSTGSAMTSIYSGLAPQQHASTGWWVYLREFGLVSRILPYSNAIDYNVLGESISHVIDVTPLPSLMTRDYYAILSERIVDSEFTRNIVRNAKRIAYDNELRGLLNTVKNTINHSEGKKYIQAYWPYLDEVSHLLGPSSKEARDHLLFIDAKIENLLESINGTNTTLIITSDHGLVDVPKANSILTQDHPELTDTLILPLCGDTRSVFCYVRPWQTDRFEAYIHEAFGNICELHRSKDLIEQEWFGLHEPNPKLLSRVGDYTLIFEENYAILNSYPGRETPELLGHHGGVSSDEMLVPLIVVDC
ncbi:MAG: alkaline phosphatase family protein [Candidatus Thorarchaeota archaeon]